MDDFSKARQFLVAGTIFSYLALFFTAFVTGFPLSVEGWYEIAIVAGITVMASFIAARHGFSKLRAIIECLACGLLLVVPITLSTYLSTWLNFPLADAPLSKWDRWLGVDWPAMMAWIDQQALLSQVLNKAYRSFGYQLLVCPALLVLFNHAKRAYQMVGAYALLCFLSSAIAVFFPALGTYAYYQFDAGSLQHIDPLYGYFFLEQFHAVRNDPAFVWRLKESAGILTFPSVHAAVAVLCAWSLWPLIWLRYPTLILNLAMGFSAVAAANHYFVDLIAGGVVALVAIASVAVLTSRSRRLSELPVPAPAPTQ